MQCPIFKGKGSSTDMSNYNYNNSNNYRGIAVGSIINKYFLQSYIIGCNAGQKTIS